jgi:hypothetical protein
MDGRSARRKAATYTHTTQTQNKRTQTSLLCTFHLTAMSHVMEGDQTQRNLLALARKEKLCNFSILSTLIQITQIWRLQDKRPIETLRIFVQRVHFSLCVSISLCVQRQFC